MSENGKLTPGKSVACIKRFVRTCRDWI